MEALNEAEAEKLAIQQTVANALQEAQDAQSALVSPTPLSHPSLFCTTAVVTSG